MFKFVVEKGSFSLGQRAVFHEMRNEWASRAQVEGEGTVPSFVLVLCRSHALWMVGGIIFCSTCGALVTSNRNTRLREGANSSVQRAHKGEHACCWQVDYPRPSVIGLICSLQHLLEDRSIASSWGKLQWLPWR